MPVTHIKTGKYISRTEVLSRSDREDFPAVLREGGRAGNTQPLPPGEEGPRLHSSMYLLWLGVPALHHERLESMELHFLGLPQNWADALGQLLGNLKLVVTQGRTLS